MGGQTQAPDPHYDQLLVDMTEAYLQKKFLKLSQKIHRTTIFSIDFNYSTVEPFCPKTYLALIPYLHSWLLRRASPTSLSYLLEVKIKQPDPFTVNTSFTISHVRKV